MMNKYLEINFSVDRLKVGIYYMCRRLFDKIESTETGIIVCYGLFFQDYGQLKSWMTIRKKF